ncbi:hypothetical protein T4B_13823 [Trichinella pseudospiralis]|uniref:Uncharacterized protein n=1 Tax=Trichinella pseudospiralis TaxID=6337 RepID=A0A0V1JUP4_TRIPS|nr:hypothetical protein T4B_13823 [Trichinella pseudospiralis]KRZ38632.1 hypothetical protein T4C_1046 [Trichinella pseudospiralis]
MSNHKDNQKIRRLAMLLLTASKYVHASKKLIENFANSESAVSNEVAKIAVQISTISKHLNNKLLMSNADDCFFKHSSALRIREIVFETTARRRWHGGPRRYCTPSVTKSQSCKQLTSKETATISGSEAQTCGTGQACFIEQSSLHQQGIIYLSEAGHQAAVAYAWINGVSDRTFGGSLFHSQLLDMQTVYYYRETLIESSVTFWTLQRWSVQMQNAMHLHCSRLAKSFATDVTFERFFL